MAATLSLSLQGSNYDTLSAEQQQGLAKPELSNDAWTLRTTKKYEDLRVENFGPETVDIKKAKFERFDFRYNTNGGMARIERSSLNSASFTSEAGVNSEDALVFGSRAKLSNNSADLGNSNDFLEFKAGSQSAGGNFNLGEGKDTAVFGPRFQERCHPFDPSIRGLEDMTNASLQRGR